MKLSTIENKIIQDTVTLINERSINFSNREYRRILGAIIKRLFYLRNMDWHKEKKETDFTEINNPKGKSYRLKQVGISRNEMYKQ